MPVALDGGPGNWKELGWGIGKRKHGRKELCGQISKKSGSKTLCPTQMDTMGIFKITFFFVGVGSNGHSSLVEGRDHLQESILPLHHAAPRGQTQVVRLDNTCRHLPSHLTGPAQNFHIPVGSVPVLWESPSFPAICSIV